MEHDAMNGRSSTDRFGDIVTIGTFDGIHRGHQWLLQSTVKRARETGASSVAVTFEPIPVSVLRPELYQGRLVSRDQKLALMSATGIDRIETIEFTRNLAALSAAEFLTELSKRFSVGELRVGSDFALGRNRSGDVTAIAAIGRELGFETVSLDRISDGDAELSSTQIRLAILRGDIATTNRLLGRPYSVAGKIVHGAHLGRKIGYPTANFVPPPDLVPLADGIYASVSALDDDPTPLPGMTYVGTRPTVDGGDRHIETHLFDFDRDIYDHILTIQLVDRIREDRQFDSLEELVRQLDDDETSIRSRLNQESPAGAIDPQHGA